MSNIFITGGTGRLGKYLIKEFPGCLHPTSKELDVTDSAAVDSYIEKHKPDIIIHAAAWVDIRASETDHKKTWEVNVGGTENMVNSVMKYIPNSYFIYPSTACVFPGDKGDYTEEDAPYPKNMYSVTKLVGEHVVNRLKNYLIIRTDFVERTKWRYPGAFSDRYSTCVFSDTLAKAFRDVIDKKVTGLIHLTGKKKISHFDLAKITTPDVKPIKLEDMDIPMPRDQSLKSVKGWDILDLEY